LTVKKIMFNSFYSINEVSQIDFSSFETNNISNPSSKHPKLKKLNNKHSEDFPFNNYNESISSLITSKLDGNPGFDNLSILETFITNCSVEKSDSIKIEYLLFFNENFSWFFTSDFKKHEYLIKNLFEILKESLVSTNYLLKFHLIRTLTNLMIVLDLKTLYPEFFQTFKSFLLTSLQDKILLKSLRSLIAQSLLELEDFYPGLLENDILLEPEGGVKPFESKSSSLISYKNRLNQSKESIVSDVSGLINALSLRNYSLVSHYPSKSPEGSLSQSKGIIEKGLNLFELYKIEKSQVWAYMLLLLVEICENQIRNQMCFFKELPNKTLQLVKKLISHMITDLNHLSYFTRIFIQEKLDFFLNIWKMSSKVVLPLFLNMLKSQGNLYVLSNLLILNLYYEEFELGFCEEFIQRLFYDVNDESLSSEEKCLVIYWMMNLKRFTKENVSIKDIKQLKFYGLLTQILEDLLPKPHDHYVLKEKKILAYLNFHYAIEQCSAEKIISILLNFQIFKNFAINSDITSLFFRIIYACIKHLPFEEYLKDLSEFMFEIIQHKPKFALNFIELFSKLKISSKKSIVPAFLTGFSLFLTKIEPPICINNYFDLMVYTINEPSVSPNEILISLYRLIQAQDQGVLSPREIYITNENVLYLCKKILKNYQFDTISPHLNRIFNYIAQNALDFTIKDTAKIYLLLLNNLNESKLAKIFFKHPKQNASIFSYNPSNNCQIKEYLGIQFELCFKERKELGIEDGACAIFGDLSLFLLNKPYKGHSLFKNFLNLDDFANNFTLLEDDSFLKPNPFSITINDFARVFNKKINKNQTFDQNNEGNKKNLIEKELETAYCQELKIMRQNSIEEIIGFSEKISGCFSDSSLQHSYEFKSFVFSLFFLEFLHNPPFITLPMNLSLLKKNDIFYSLIILFAGSEHYEEIPCLFIPFLENCETQITYKILLKVFVKNPVPMRISTGFFCTGPSEQILLGTGTSIDLRFEDMFLPLRISKKMCDEIKKTYKLNIEEKDEGIFKDFIKLIIFEFIWTYGIHKKENEYEKCVESARLLNNTQEKILNLNANYLRHFWIHEPFSLENEEKEERFEGKSVLLEVLKKVRKEIGEFDFEFEKELEKNKGLTISNKIYYSPVMIILPDKYMVLFKIMIHESCTLIRIKTNIWKSLKHIDSFFDNWNEKP